MTAGLISNGATTPRVSPEPWALGSVVPRYSVILSEFSIDLTEPRTRFLGHKFVSRGGRD